MKIHQNTAKVKSVLPRLDRMISYLFLKSFKQQLDFNKAWQLVLDYTLS